MYRRTRSIALDLTVRTTKMQDPPSCLVCLCVFCCCRAVSFLLAALCTTTLLYVQWLEVVFACTGCMGTRTGSHARDTCMRWMHGIACTGCTRSHLGSLPRTLALTAPPTCNYVLAWRPSRGHSISLFSNTTIAHAHAFACTAISALYVLELPRGCREQPIITRESHERGNCKATALDTRNVPHNNKSAGHSMGRVPSCSGPRYVVGHVMGQGT